MRTVNDGPGCGGGTASFDDADFVEEVCFVDRSSVFFIFETNSDVFPIGNSFGNCFYEFSFIMFYFVTFNVCSFLFNILSTFSYTVSVPP